MNYALGICIIILTILNWVQSKKIKNVITSQNETNVALNETRGVVSKLVKKVKET